MQLKMREFLLIFIRIFWVKNVLPPMLSVDRAPAPMLIIGIVRSLKYLLYAIITDQSINQFNH